MKPAILCVLLFFSNVPSMRWSLAQDTDKVRNKPFSRSAWITARMNSTRFSGGVLPSSVPETPSRPFSEQSVSPIRSLVRTNVLANVTSTPPVQVSSDLLPSDSAAQPGTHAEPYVDASLGNPMNLVGGWQENRFETGGSRCLSYGTSTDGGQTWTTNLIPHLTTADGGVWERASDPWVAFGPSNRVYYSSLLFNETTPDNAIGVSVSTDGGITWADPVEINHTRPKFNDKDSVTVDANPFSPHFGSVYVAWDLNNSANKQWIVVSRSTDGGATFQTPVRVGKKGGENIGAIPRVGPDGTVYVLWLGGSGGSCGNALYISRSDDGGVTWTPKQLVAQVCSPGVKGLRTGDGLPSFALNPATGFLYAAWQDQTAASTDSSSQVGRAVLSMSRDRGRTWSTPARISDGPDDAPVFTVSVAALPDGKVAVSYYSLQNDPARSFLADEYVRISSDGGTTFTPSVRVTPASFDLRQAALADQGSPFLGDYQGLAGAAGRFHLLWINPGIISSVTGKPQPEALSSTTE